MARRAVLVLSLAAVALGVWAFHDLAWVASRGGVSAPLYSTRRYDPYGTAALREFLAERGIQVRTLERPRLEKTDRGVLIQVFPLRREEEWCLGCGGTTSFGVYTDALAEWIAAGNTVVQLTRERTELMAALGLPGTASREHRQTWLDLEWAQSTGTAPDELLWPLVFAAWTRAGLRRIRRWADVPGPLVLHEPRALSAPDDMAGWQALACVGGRPVAAEVRHGHGRLVVAGAPTPALNGGLPEGGNLEFLLALAGDGPVILDDWSHGIGHEGTIVGLIRKFGLVPLIGQMLFVLALYVWSTRGHHRAERREPRRRRSTAEQVATLGYLYARTLSRSETVRRVRREVVGRLSDALGVAPEAVEARARKLAPAERPAFDAVLSALRDLDTTARGRRWSSELARVLTLSHELARETPHARRTD